MSKTVWDLLLGSLEDLGAEKFKRFTDKLIDSGLEPRLRRNAVEGKDCGDIASKLIETYTETRALGVAVDVLNRIGSNQIAMDLQKEAEAHGFSLTSGSGGSAGVQPPPKEARFIDEKWTKLVEKAVSMDAVLDELLCKNVINREQYSDLKAKSTPQQKMRELICGPIHSAGDLGKIVLYKILMEQQPYMMKDLGAR
ncbi:hypothetical protein NFI96_014812 [Prochilodus magdalenae]|nr:hypothetical protein NFI96_014812 [Prochilodus magdalenae]